VTQSTEVIMDNYLAFHPHLLIDVEPALGRRPLTPREREEEEAHRACRPHPRPDWLDRMGEKYKK
jgi:hypothetical protein